MLHVIPDSRSRQPLDGISLSLLMLVSLSNFTTADDVETIMAGYLTVPNERVSMEYDGGFSLYVNAWPLLENYPGRRFQTGLFGTWMFPLYDPPVPRPLKEGIYTDIEGGLGWWRDTRFATPTPKFIMGGVALNFIEWANGPGAGKGRDWTQPRGKYAVIQITPNLLWPPDGLNLKQGTANQWFGYGYLPLPLTRPVTDIAGTSFPTGNQCWTLFLNTRGFKGPVAFFNPRFWTRHAVDRNELQGKLLDDAAANPNRALQMETQYIPSAQASSRDGVRYARIAPTSFPAPRDSVSEVVQQITSYRRSALWDQVNAWFAGDEVAPGRIAPTDFQVHSLTGGGGASWALFKEGTPREKRIPIQWPSFAKATKTDDQTFGYRWTGDWVRRDLDTGNLVTLPDYYRLSGEGPRQRWIPVAAEDVPDETGLQEVTFDAFRRPETEPYTTPEADDSVWQTPGPAAGPYQVVLGDGSQLTYCWYKFRDQPAMVMSGMTEDQRDELQRRIELLHRHWKHDRNYLPPPRRGELAELDPGLLVFPPDGMEVGYVPIVTRQASAN
ncbi:MAG: hypothetical protein AAGJ40_00760 [Planctomycetota bacterium]